MDDDQACLKPQIRCRRCPSDSAAARTPPAHTTKPRKPSRRHPSVVLPSYPIHSSVTMPRTSRRASSSPSAAPAALAEPTASAGAHTPAAPAMPDQEFWALYTSLNNRAKWLVDMNNEVNRVLENVVRYVALVLSLQVDPHCCGPRCRMYTHSACFMVLTACVGRPHAQKLQCARLFDPIREMADDLRTEIANKVPIPALKEMLEAMLESVGDALVQEGWTWDELRAKKVHHLPRSACWQHAILANLHTPHVTPASCSCSSTARARS